MRNGKARTAAHAARHPAVAFSTLSLSMNSSCLARRVSLSRDSSGLLRRIVSRRPVQAVLPILLLGLMPILLLAASGTRPAVAQGTQLWTQSATEMTKGTPLGVSVSSDGILRRGPLATELQETSSTFVWSLATDAHGQILVGTGTPASVQRLSPDGKSATTLLKTKALAIQALAVGPDGAIYAATMPDGRVYRIDPEAKTSLDTETAKPIFDLAAEDQAFADQAAPDQTSPDQAAEKAAKSTAATSKAHYIWAMTFDSAGRLYLATGGPGVIYRLDPRQPASAATRFFVTDEQHIRSLAWDKAGNLIAGSDGSGLVYRIHPDGKGVVLFAAPHREVTALSVDAEGTIWVANAGDKSHTPLPALPVSSGGQSITITFSQPGSVQAANASSTLPDGTEIDALTDGQAPRKIWQGHDEIVYGLAATADGLLAVTGNQGRILLIQNDGVERDLAHVNAQQALALVPAGRDWLIATANPGTVYRLADGGSSSEHAYASSVLDAGALARWGRVEVDPDSTGYHLWTRSGNVEQPVRRQSDWGWTDWMPLKDGQIASPAGRYLQWKAVLDPGGHLSGVGVNYLPVNAAPVVDAIVVAPGARYTPQPASTSSQTINISFPSSDGAAADSTSTSSPLQAQKDRSAVTVRWAAHDDNGDTLSYSLYLRGDGEHIWRPLKRNLQEKAWSFDADTIPDGGYQVRVVASDLPSHTPADALEGELTSDRFVLDTTPPLIQDLHAGAVTTACAGAAHCIPVEWSAQDATSPIARAQYSIDAGPWQYVEPVGALSDARTEHYSLKLPLPQEDDPAAEHRIAVRVYDRYENAVVAKILVAAAPAATRSSSTPSGAGK